MIRILLLVGVGGFLGSIARYLSQEWSNRLFAVPFPVGTLTVNVAGSLLIGVIYALVGRHAPISNEWRLFLATGFCGGFTTFSALSYETVTLMRNGMPGYALLYVTGSLVLGVLATFVGFWLAKC